MTDKLEALSHPDYTRYDCGSCGHETLYVQHKNICPVCSHRPMSETHLYSQEYVTALLATLEEKDKQIAHQKICLDNEIKSNAWAFNRIRELEQRLQQPIKLPKREIGMACEFVSDHIVVSLAAVLAEAATAGFKAEVEGE